MIEWYKNNRSCVTIHSKIIRDLRVSGELHSLCNHESVATQSAGPFSSPSLVGILFCKQKGSYPGSPSRPAGNDTYTYLQPEVRGHHLLSRTIITSAADLFLFNPAISSYSAMQYVPDSRMRSTVSRSISDHQPLDQHLPTTLSADSPFSSATSVFIIVPSPDDWPPCPREEDVHPLAWLAVW